MNCVNQRRLGEQLKLQRKAHNAQSDMDKHKRVLVLNRPFGVNIMMPGGLCGYCGGKMSLP
jgi:hypothetical protein